MTPPAPPAPPARTAWFAIAALALGVFGMVTVEELPIGVLTLTGRDLGVSDGTMGWTVTLPGYLAAVASLTVPVLARRADRRHIVVVALLIMVAGSLLSAAATRFDVLLASRLVVGLAIGAFWTIAPTIAARIAAPADVPRATALVFAGGSVATVAGVPLATVLGAAWGWRAAYAVIGLVGVVCAAVCWRVLAPLPPRGAPPGTTAYARAARSPYIAVGVLATLGLVTAHFGSLTFASPFLQHRAGVAVAQVGVLLAVAGVAGLLGNFAIAWVVARSPGAALVTVAFALAAAQLGFWAAARTPWSAAVMMACWGAAGGSVAASTQGWINGCDHDLLDIATGLNSAAFNAAIATGALTGGLLLNSVGEGAVLPTTAALAALVGLGVAAYCLSVGGRRAGENASR